MDWKTRKIKFHDHYIQTHIAGEGIENVLLIHDHLDSQHIQKSHEFLVHQGYRMIICNSSNKSIWRVDHFADIVEEIRNALELSRFHLMGETWGGLPAIEYNLHYPHHVATLTLINSTPSISLLDQALKKIPGNTLEIDEQFKNWERLFSIYQIQNPVFLISDQHHSAQIAEVAQGYFPHSRFMTIQGTGRNFFFEVSDVYQKHVLQFLKIY